MTSPKESVDTETTLMRTTYGAAMISVPKGSAEEEDSNESAPEASTSLEPERKPIQEGDWVLIKDPAVAELYFQGRAKVCMLITGLVDTEGKPVIIPERRSSAKDRAFYEEQCRIGTRQELRAVLYGAKVDGTGWLEYQKTIPTERLEKSSKPTSDPQFIPPKPAKKKANGNGNFAFPVRESVKPKIADEDEIRMKRRPRREK